MPFFAHFIGRWIFPADGFHVETIMGEGFVNLVAYLKTVDMDAWPNLRYKVGRTGTIDGSHLCHSLLNDTLNGSSPAGMNGANGLMGFVV